MDVLTDYRKFYPEIIKTLVRLIEEKDPFMKGHSERVAGLCLSFLKKLGFPQAEVQKVYLAGLVHDIGMVYIPEQIVLKPEKLTEEERIIVMQHPVLAEKILSHLTIMKPLLPIIRHHHENHDGSGYPDGLKGSAIPEEAQILAIFDSYDAMMSPRPHRPARSMDEVLEEMEKSAGDQYEPNLLKRFISFIKPAPAPEVAPGEAQAQEEAPQEEGAMAAVNNIIQRFKAGKIELPVLPSVINEIQKIIKSPIATTDDLAKAIEKDAVISLKLISTSNSTLYRGAKKVSTVREAVPRLGLKQTQSVVNAIANKGLYQSKKEEYSSLMVKLWMHSLAVAYGSRSIAKKLKFEDIEKFFLLGLIHDIGKVLILKALTEKSGINKDFPLEEVSPVMQKVHMSFGSVLLERWGFSQEFMNVASLHEGTEFSDKTAKEILAVNLANNMTRTIGQSLFEDAGLDLAGLESAKLLKMNADDIQSVCDETGKIMQDSPQSF